MPTPPTESLAVVIPAYKPDYLAAALASLAAQTDPGFRVYIGDDASPHDLAALVQPFTNRLDLSLHRFEKNIGRRDLAAQWNRTIRLSNETWIWLFSDDDVADPGCVATWRAALGGTNPVEVMRFQTRNIGADGREDRQNELHPEFESAADFVLARLRLQRRSYACEYLFSRRAFDRVGGLISFPIAWCSDDASWAALAGSTGLRTLAGPLVSWRYGGGNLSVPNPATRAAKREALLCYVEWLLNEDHSAMVATPAQRAAIRAAIPPWFWHQLNVADALMRPVDLRRLADRLGQPCGPRQLLGHNLRRLARRIKAHIRP
jgi:hypothetical protein